MDFVEPKNPYTNPVSSVQDPSLPSKGSKISVIFSVSDGVGSLNEALTVVKDQGLNMTRIESRPSRTKGVVDFFIDFDNVDENQVKVLSDKLEQSKKGHIAWKSATTGTVWFPRKMKDLDSFSAKSLEFGAELDSDHPGFTDEEYRRRRLEITNFARSYKFGQHLPTVNYNKQELQTWATVYNKLRELVPTHACYQYNRVFPLLESHCGYSADKIPQLHDVSDYLHDLTGWRLRPVTGLLTSRDFLNAFAFRVFHSTQYIRHHSKPFYTPEPDVCHELLGHVPLFADPEFADFSQEIGLASLGASDADIEKLATVYWFTVEFGLCREKQNHDNENGKGSKGVLKAYGAGLLSSFGELEYCLSDKPRVLEFDPEVTSSTKYPITTYQPLYFATESFDDAKRKVKAFADSMDRPFQVRYNAITENIEVLDKKDSILKFARDIHGEMKTLITALEKLQQ